jgi:glycosyltransferase involved in cell wall biosynthesis
MGIGTTGPQVAVVVPTRDRPALVSRALGSALRQRDATIEVIVVDDGSSPALQASQTLARVFADPRVRIVRNATSQGVAAARNRGIEAATAPWVAFLDDDDLWAPTKLARQLAALAEAPDARWSYTGEAIVDANLHVVWVNPAPPAEAIKGRLLAGNAVPGGGSSVVASRDLLVELGGFDESFSIMADWDMWTRLAIRVPAAPVDEPLMGYVLHPSAMSRDVPRSWAEYERMEEKYRSVRSECGAALNRHDYLLYISDLDRRAGHRWRAARLSVRAARAEPDPRALLFAAATLLWPGFPDVMDRRSRAQCPAPARATAERWMADVIGASGLPRDS